MNRFLLFAAIGCASTNTPPADVDSGTATPPPVVDDASAGFGPDVPDQCVPTCSADLHTVLCGGEQTVCPPDKGCAGGVCVPACEAAELGKTNIGCDYLANPFTELPSTGCFLLFLANTWNAPVGLTVESDGKTVDGAAFARIPKGSGSAMTYEPLPGGKIPVDQVAVVSLRGMSSSDCPIAPVATGWEIGGTKRGKAIRARTSAPVAAYSIARHWNGGTTSTASDGAALRLPTSAWGTDYIAVAARPLIDPVSGFHAVPILEIIAQEDGTSVTIVPTADIPAATDVAGATKGKPTVYAMKKNEAITFWAGDMDLTGSAISATKKIEVVAVQSLLFVNGCCGDEQHQQLPHAHAFGHEYVGARYRERIGGSNEPAHWRIVGAADGTTLSWDPPTSGAPTTVNKGEAKDFDAPGPFVVSSQDADHSFFFAEYMTGGDNAQGTGDPEMVTVIATEQYLPHFTFLTDPIYANTNVVVVRKKQKGIFEDVTLDCAGVLTGWTAVGGSGQYEMTRVDLTKGFAKQGSCDNGHHVATSGGPFGLTVWAWGDPDTNTAYSSYGFAAGSGSSAINSIVVLPPK